MMFVEAMIIVEGFCFELGNCNASRILARASKIEICELREHTFYASDESET